MARRSGFRLIVGTIAEPPGFEVETTDKSLCNDQRGKMMIKALGLFLGTLSGGFFSKGGSEPTSKTQDERERQRAIERAEKRKKLRERDATRKKSR